MQGSDPVTVVLTRRVLPGREADFEEVIQGLLQDAMEFPGNLGVNVFRPAGPGDHEYRFVFKFASHDSHTRWLNSDARGAWVRRLDGLVDGEAEIEEFCGLETWFTLPGQGVVQPPARYKMAVVTFLAIFPLVIGSQVVSQRFLSGVPSLPRSAFVTAILVTLMTYAVMPLMTRLFKAWLYGR